MTGRSRTLTGIATLGWAATPFVLGVFVLLRYVSEARWALIASQVVFLLPLSAAVVTMLLSGGQSRRGTRARATWLLLSAAAGCLLVGEVAYTARILGALDEVLAWRVFDTVNAAAVLFFFAGSGVAAGLERRGLRRALRVLFDGLAVLALAFGALYGFVGEPYLRASGDLVGALRVSSYALVGIALLGAGAMVFTSSYALRAPWNRVLAFAIGAIALAVTVWSVFGAGGHLSEGGAADTVASTLYLLAYHLLFLAGLQRLSQHGRVWTRVPPLRLVDHRVEIVASSLAFIAVAALTGLAVAAREGGISSGIYTGAAAVAAVCMVVRTAAVSAEGLHLSAQELRDPVTGVMGPRLLERAWDAVIDGARARGGTVACYCVDIDGFAQVNAANGFHSGDVLLREVGRQLERSAGAGGWVLRFGADEFFVLTVVRGEQAVADMGWRLCAAVRSAGRPARVTASVGAAFHPDDGRDAHTLMSSAMAASLWAKRQGKDRFAAYDERMSAALTLDDRLAAGHTAGRDMAHALVAAADARDPLSHDHSRNVAALSRVLAMEVGLDPERVERIELAAVLHDIGKIALPNVMLGGRTLTARERVISAEHCQLGERLLEYLASEGIPAWVRAHHERWDGAGFPDGLVGESIPLEARIIALADAYDGMTAGRRYGAPMSKAAALQEIDLGMGTRFDPDLAEAFIIVVGGMGSPAWSEAWGSS